MSFSPLANMSRRIPSGGRQNPRMYAVSGVGIHHNAGVDAYGEASNPARQVSANYWIANDGTILPNIDEEARAWTSGHISYPAGALADHRNITVEVSNSPEGVRNGSWAISAAARNSLVRLIADVYRRYNLGSVRRGADRGVGVHQDWVATACPGPYIMSQLGSIIAEAEQLRSGGGGETNPRKDTDEMLYQDQTGLMFVSDEFGTDRIVDIAGSTDNTETVWGARSMFNGGNTEPRLNNRQRDILITGSSKRWARIRADIVADVKKAIGTPQVDSAVIASKIIDAIQKQGVKVDSTVLAKELETALADEFASIPSAVVDEQANRLKE